MESNVEKSRRYLQDLHAAECGTEQLLLTYASNSSAPESVRSTSTEVVMQCRNRQRQIEERLSQLGGNISTTKDWVDTMASQFTMLWNAGHDNIEKMTVDLVKAYATCHLLKGSYCALSSFSDSIDDYGTKELADKGMEESTHVAGSLIPLIQQIARYAPVQV